jgi:hypothetical protein
MKNLTTEERKKTLLEGNEIELAIEGRFTNLRIFASIPKESRPLNDGKVRFRLDRANQYSVPLKDDTIVYLEKEHAAISKLNELYGFEGATLEDIDNILEIVKDMVSRQCVEW